MPTFLRLGRNFSLHARGASPPVWPFRINRDNPLAEGLVGAYPLGIFPGDARNIADSGLRTMAETSGSGPIVSALSVNSARHFIRGDKVHFENTSDPWMTTLPFSFACWFRVTTDVDQNYSPVSIGSGAAENRSDLRLQGGGGADNVQMSVRAQSVEAKASSSTSYTINDWHQATGVGFRNTGGSNEAWAFLNGGGKGTATATGLDLSGIDRCYLGAVFVSVLTNYLEGDLAHCLVWNRALNDKEAWQLYDPRTRWDLYEPQRARVFVDVPAVGGGGVSPGTHALLGVGI